MHVNSATTETNPLLTIHRTQGRFAQTRLPDQTQLPAQNAATTDTQAPHTADAPMKTRRPLLERLMAKWGQTNSRFDFDGNGTVGTGDLLKVLERMAKRAERHQMPAPMPQPEMPGMGMEAQVGQADETGQTKKRESNPLEKLLAAWGQTDSEFDLDGDGIVGSGDLMEMLRQMAEQSGVPTPALAGLTDALGQLEPGSTPDASTLQQLLAAWGQAGTNFDFDSNGEVGTGDLLAMLQRMSGGAHQTPATPGDIPVMGGELPLHSPTTRAMFDHLARSLMQTFDPAQPQKLFDTVEDSSMGGAQKSFLMSKLASMMPRGLHISTTA